MGKANDPIDHKYGISDEQRARREESRNRDDGPWPTIGGFIILAVILFLIIKGCS